MATIKKLFFSRFGKRARGVPGKGRLWLVKSRVWAVALAALLFVTACDISGPEARRQALHLPPLGFKGVVDKGVEPFEKYCMACHGPKGQGTEQGPPLVNQVYRPDHHADLSFHFAVRDGVKSHHWNYGDMKPVPLITPEETEHVIAFIREEQKRAGIN